MEIENVLYYTFSTTAQVLAAVGALISVYWVFVMPKLSNQIKIKSEVVLREIDPADPKKKWLELRDIMLTKMSHGTEYTKKIHYRIKSSIDQENFDWLYKEFQKINSFRENEIIKGAMDEMVKIDGRRRKITSKVKYAIIHTGMHIFFPS